MKSNDSSSVCCLGRRRFGREEGIRTIEIWGTRSAFQGIIVLPLLLQLTHSSFVIVFSTTVKGSEEFLSA